MKQKQNHYETLGVSPNAEDIVIRASYRALAQKYHPDKSTDPMASVKMTGLNAAYVVLSDSQKRLRYDAESSLDSFAPDSSTSRDTPVTLADHLDSCGVKNITSDNIYFYPNIPAKKLAGARSSYVFEPMEEDILILIDDTVFGSAKDGAVVTSDRLFIKGKFDAITVFQLSDVNQLACEDNEITVNRRRVGSLSLVGKMESRYVFHEISSFLTALARSRSQAAHPVDPALEIDTAEMERLLSKYLTPVAMKNGVDLTRFNGRYPGYYLGDNIPDTLDRTVRFLLGIPASDRLFAVVDLWDGQGEAVVFTNRGVYSRCRASDVVTAYDWSSLRGRSVRGEFEISVFNGVVFDDGRKLICGRQNAVLKPFGRPLISDLLCSISDTPAPGY